MNSYTEKIRGSRVLITGGLGFIGHNLAIYLIKNFGCEIVVVDDCSNSDKSMLGEYIARVEFHEINVLNGDDLFPLLENVDYIFHLACKQISSSGEEPNLHLDVNARSTLNILEFIRYNRPKRLKRFIYTGSTSIFGSSAKLPISENDPTLVLSNYAATKLLGENFTLMYSRNYDIPASVIRYSNVYGYGQSPLNTYCGVLGKFIHAALKQQDIQIFGDGEQTRDYTFIDDALDATILAAIHPKAFGDVYNIGTTVETSVNDLVKLIEGFVPNIEVSFVPERDIDNIRRRSIDITKIHNHLGWSPLVNIKEGIKRTIEWYPKG